MGIRWNTEENGGRGEERGVRMKEGRERGR